jgi:hypothetical protein
MAAPNKEPTGSRPGPKAPYVHAPNKGITSKDPGKPKPGPAAGTKNGVNGHGTPKPVGGGKGNPLH